MTQKERLGVKMKDEDLLAVRCKGSGWETHACESE